MREFLFCLLLLNSSSPLLEAAHRSTPQNPVVLKSESLSAIFDRKDGLPYRYGTAAGSLWGEDAGTKITAIICHLQPRAYSTIELSASTANLFGNSARFTFVAVSDGHAAATFDVVYTVSTSSMVVTLNNVKENAGYELIEVSLPDLVTVREEDGPGWLANGRNGGSLVRLNDAISTSIPEDRFFGHISSTMPVATLSSRNMSCVMEVSAFMDGTKVAVTGDPGQRHARIGTVQTYRVHGGRSYDMNDQGPRVQGNENTPNLLVEQPSKCRFDFVSKQDVGNTSDWISGARILRARMPVIPTHYFDDKFLFLIAGRYKPVPQPRTTFGQSEKLIHDISMLTDRAPQVAFVSGWVNDGQDTGYPCEDRVNESMGGFEALKHLMAQGPALNANVTLNVNYDDAYRSCSQWTPDIIARRPDGQIWKSADWAGEISYIVGMAKYMKEAGVKRVNHIVDRYNLHDAILVDALSWYAIRNDWDPAHPASGYRNLVDGRFRVIDEFRKRGVQVVSETLRYPYLGELAVSADGISGGKDIFGGEPIPLAPFVYRTAAIWGGASGASIDPMPDLFWHSRPIHWYSDATDRSEITDYYYLNVIPWMKLHALNIESFRRTGYRSEIGLERSSTIVEDWINHSYAVTVGGVPIASDGATYCQLDDYRMAFYSHSAKTLKAKLPSGWHPHQVTARLLTVSGRQSVPVEVEGDEVVVSVSASQPVIVYRNAEHASRN